MQRNFYFLLFGLTFIFFLSCGEKEVPTNWQLSSPNEAISLMIANAPTADSTNLSYSVSFQTATSLKEVILPSSLGIRRADADFAELLAFVAAETIDNQSVSYTMKTGGQSKYENEFNELQLTFENVTKDKIKINFRAYNNGVAFQYEFPESSTQTVRIVEELTAFQLGEGNFWAQPYDAVTKWSPGYERFYEQFPIGTNAPEEKNGWALPLLFETNGIWTFISESGFDGTYGGSHIKADTEGGRYAMKFAEPTEANNLYSIESTVTLPYQTPWRFIAIGDELADIVASHLVTDLAKENQLEDTDWIVPGRASWSWWSVNDSPQDYNLLVPFVDLAAEMGWAYSLVDANWNNMKNGTLEDLAAYAKTKNVDLLVWYNSGGKHNSVEEAPRDLMFERTVRRNEFERIQEMGIKGIKVDFFQSDKPVIINQYVEILEDAADYELLVNFHGCTLPKGWRRTYPNLMTMEAILGGEAYIFSEEYPTKSPAHITTIPFLRGVAGPTDYTPGGFASIKMPHLTTYSFEAALPIVIESGITHYVSSPEIVASLPSFAVDLLKEVPSVWEATKYLYGYPGKEVVIARKSGNRWYIGGINGENKAKTLRIDLSAIAKADDAIALIIDGDDARSLEQQNRQLKGTFLEVEVMPFGGFVGTIIE